MTLRAATRARRRSTAPISGSGCHRLLQHHRRSRSRRGRADHDPGQQGHRRLLGIDTCNSDSTTCDDARSSATSSRAHTARTGPAPTATTTVTRRPRPAGRRQRVHRDPRDGNHSDCLQSVWTGDNLVFRKNYLTTTAARVLRQGPARLRVGTSGVCEPVQGIRSKTTCSCATRNVPGEHARLRAAGCPSTSSALHERGDLPQHGLGRRDTSLLGLREGVAAGTKVEGNATTASGPTPTPRRRSSRTRPIANWKGPGRPRARAAASNARLPSPTPPRTTPPAQRARRRLGSGRSAFGP